MNVSFRRHWFLALLLPLALAACGNSEPDQRAAFKQFLQTRIIDKPGVHIAKPNDEERESFGDYAAHYDVILNFDERLNDSVKPLAGISKKLRVTTPQDMFNVGDTLKEARTGLVGMGEAMKKSREQADAERAQLKQPDDLKVVYDKAYDRIVTEPSDTYLALLPEVDTAMTGIEDMSRFLQEHKDQIKVSGSQLQVEDPKLLAELNTRLQALNAQSQVVQKAGERLQALMLGR